MAVALLILATAFVAVEFACWSRSTACGSRPRRRPVVAARVALAVVRRLSFHLSGAELGVTLCSLVLGFVAGADAGPGLPRAR